VKMGSGRQGSRPSSTQLSTTVEVATFFGTLLLLLYITSGVSVGPASLLVQADWLLCVCSRRAQIAKVYGVVVGDGVGTRAERYEALLRAANAIASCSDCDAAADALAKELREVISFDYLQIVAFENETDVVGWHLLYLNGARKDVAGTNALPEGTPMGGSMNLSSSWSRLTGARRISFRNMAGF